MSHALPAIAWGLAAAGPLLLVTFALSAIGALPLPAPLDLARASGRARLQIVAGGLLASLTVSALGWLLIAVGLPLATDMQPYATAGLITWAAVMPALLGLLLGVHAHARLLVVFLTGGRRDSQASGIRHLAGL